jgi:hypothetical protein
MIDPSSSAHERGQVSDGAHDMVRGEAKLLGRPGSAALDPESLESGRGCSGRDRYFLPFI